MIARVATSRRAASRSGFTLIELGIVIAIVIILLTLVLPAATQLWEERKLADAENTVRGLLTSQRAEAVRGDVGRVGAFFYVDRDGTQRVASIRQLTVQRLLELGFGSGADDFKPDPISTDDGNDNTNYELLLQNVYEVTDERTYAFAPPIRVVPRYVVEGDGGAGMPPRDFFSEAELANDDYFTPPGDAAQLHRNFFTLLFDTDGTLRVGLDALIFDFDADADNLGDVTRLRVGYGAAQAERVANMFDARNVDDTDMPKGILNHVGLGGLGVPPADRTVPMLLDNNGPPDEDINPSYTPENPGTALNFLSVDGLLVYDDQLFREGANPKEKRLSLLRTGIPLYINRQTGAVIKGPEGENLDPDTPNT